MSWKRWTVRVINVVFSILLLFVAVDMLYAFLSPIRQGSDALTLDIARADFTYRSDTPVFGDSTMADEYRMLLAAEPPLYRLTSLLVTTETARLSLSITVPEAHRLSQYILNGTVSRRPNSFLEAAFGEMYFDGTRFDEVPVNLVTWEVHPDTRDVTVIVEVNREADEEIALWGSLADIRPQKDTVHIELDHFVLQDLQPAPEVYQNGVADIVLDDGRTYLSVTAVSLIPQSDLNSSPQTTTAFRESRQRFLQRLGGIIDVPFLTALAFSVLEALPVIIFIYWVQTTESPPWFAQVMIKPLVGLMIFHFTLYLLSGCNDFFRETRLWSNIIQRWPQITHLFYNVSYSLTLQSGPTRVSALILGIWLPAVLRPSPAVKTGRRRFGQLVQFLLVVLLMSGVLVPLLVYWGRWSDSWNGLLTGYAAVPVWTLILIGVSTLLLVISWLLRHLYMMVTQSKPRPGLFITASFLLIITASYDALQGVAMLEPWLDLFWPLLSTGLSLSLLIALVITIRPMVTAVFPNLAITNWQKNILWLLGILLAVPMNSFVDPVRSFAYETDLLFLAFRLDNLIVFIWLAGVAWILYSETRNSPEITPFTRQVGILAFATLIFTPTIRWFFIPINFLLGWLLLWRFVKSSSYWQTLQPFYRQVFTERQSLLDQIVDLSAAQKTFNFTRDQLREKLTDKDKPITLQNYHTQLAEMRSDLRQLEKKATIKKRKLHDVALTFGPYATAWQNGIHGAVYGLLLGSPWIIISLRAFLLDPMPKQTYPLWGLLLGLLTIFLNWAGRGFFFGYFYPYLRGSNGLQKGLIFFVITILPTVPMMAIGNSSQEAWQASLYWILQVFLHTMLLGLFAFDYLTLRQGRNHNWRILFEVHGISSIGASVSTIVLALGTTITTLMTNQAVTLATNALRFVLPVIQGENIPGG